MLYGMSSFAGKYSVYYTQYLFNEKITINLNIELNIFSFFMRFHEVKFQRIITL